uniref:Uncharacterized mitochondrial protein AtMg00810-like n=1 Tax=Nicotiana tabacum TaxID=4097 RepID=A0A1S4AJI2_TOBAC|nr:PREDICTED: uncharacterized mitochondrial protein AtMg00810-like [Nicotiana tabacum]
MIYIDDIVVTGSNSSQVQTTIQLLGDRFSIKDLSPLHFFLGVEVLRNAHSLILTQIGFIADLLEKFSMLNSNSVGTPMSVGEALSLNDNSTPADAKLYIWQHWQATKRLLRYLKGTITYGLHFYPSSSLKLQAYSDVDWDGLTDTRHSTSAYVILLGNNPISWCSKNQRTVARSSTKAEYRAVASVVVELNWITSLLKDLHIPISSSPVVFCDNIGATYLSRNPVFHSHMKHVAIDFHFVRDLLERNKLSVNHIPTGDQLSDA